jgi:hypothetical protein
MAFPPDAIVDLGTVAADGTMRASMEPTERGRRGGSDVGPEPAAALLLSHPGHELRVHGFVERARPLVWVVTDGSGRTATARTRASAALLAAVGARVGSLFGRLSDRQLYAAVRSGEPAPFIALAEEIADALVSQAIVRLVSDAPEHEILAHDLIAAVADAAVALAERRGHAIAHYDFPLHAAPETCPPHARERALRVELDDEALARKRGAAERYPEIAGEVAHDRVRHGDGAFRVELLRPVDRPFERIRPSGCPPWQLHGEELVHAGVYPEAIRYDRHVAPIVDELCRVATGGSPCAS